MCYTKTFEIEKPFYQMLNFAFLKNFHYADKDFNNALLQNVYY